MLDGLVDFKLFCGNIFVGVVLVVIEMGLVVLIEDEIVVNIWVVNIEFKMKVVV